MMKRRRSLALLSGLVLIAAAFWLLADVRETYQALSEQRALAARQAATIEELSDELAEVRTELAVMRADNATIKEQLILAVECIRTNCGDPAVIITPGPRGPTGTTGPRGRPAPRTTTTTAPGPPKHGQTTTTRCTVDDPTNGCVVH